MDPQSTPYAEFALVRDMWAAVDVIRTFDPRVVEPLVEPIGAAGKLLLTGEGSSRLFPAKNAIAQSRRAGWPLVLHTESGRQSQEYCLGDWAVLALSNSGRTAEVIRLFAALKESGHPRRYSVAAQSASLLEELATAGCVLKCGKEGAVAATKSVIEQALFCRALVEAVAGECTLHSRLDTLATAFTAALSLPIDPDWTGRLARAGTIYFAGRNDGVAEELVLKTNEITRRRSDFLEGTYAVHGIEEVMQPDDVLVWIDPYPEAEQKFLDTLVRGVGLTVLAVASRSTLFPTLRIPEAGDLNGYVQLAAGWNLLVETGVRLGVNLDRPQRARKVGNEYLG
uniref:Sugar isomerase n=1 Tax=Schlesneria paludicola TaxID=360056 RepID=A0A7C4LJA7_9PLAN